MFVRFGQLANPVYSYNLYDETFEQVLDEILAPMTTGSCRTAPAMDVARYENETVVVAELPGVKKEDVKISLENEVLTISGERKPVEMAKDAKVLLNEVAPYKFERSFRVGHKVNADSINAELVNGVLRVTLPVAKESLPKQIEIR